MAKLLTKTEIMSLRAVQKLVAAIRKNQYSRLQKLVASDNLFSGLIHGNMSLVTAIQKEPV
jgi:hypothetical protein